MASGGIVQEADTDVVRARLHGMWSSVAPAWGEHADYVDVHAAEVTDAMLNAVCDAGRHRDPRAHAARETLEVLVKCAHSSYLTTSLTQRL